MNILKNSRQEREQIRDVIYRATLAESIDKARAQASLARWGTWMVQRIEELEAKLSAIETILKGE